MKTITKTYYQCEVCKQEYTKEEDALECEARPVKGCGVAVGDIVKILSGDGTGKLLKVEEVHICSKDWGHYAWERYWHTEKVTGPVLDSYGHRVLTFDQMELVNKQPDQD